MRALSVPGLRIPIKGPGDRGLGTGSPPDCHAEDHALAETDKLRWKHLQGLPWVLISRQVAPAFRDLFSQLTRTSRSCGPRSYKSQIGSKRF